MSVKRWIVGFVVAASLTTGGVGTAQAISPLERNGSVTDASTDLEVANYAYRDQTMYRFSQREAIAYASGAKTAVQATPIAE